MSVIRYLQLKPDWPGAREQLSDNLRDVQEALSRRVATRLVTVSSYLATGATTTTLSLGPDTAKARAAMLVRATLSRDPTTDIPVTPRLNFVPSASGLQVYEPSGLVAQTAYDLTYLVME